MKPTLETSREDLIEMIIGRKEAARHWRNAVAAGETRLSVSGLRTASTGPASFDVRAGEAVALVFSRGAMIPMVTGRIDLTVGYGFVLWHILAISLQTLFGIP